MERLILIFVGIAIVAAIVGRGRPARRGLFRRADNRHYRPYRHGQHYHRPRANGSFGGGVSTNCTQPKSRNSGSSRGFGTSSGPSRGTGPSGRKR